MKWHCGEEMDYLGRLKEDNRKVYHCKKCDKIFAENEIPVSLYGGPTPSEIKRFEDEHPDAEACPKCGYKYYVDVFHVSVTMLPDGTCSLCRNRPELRTSR